MITPSAPRTYRLIGVDCASDVATIENAVRNIPSAENARVSLSGHLLTLPGDLDAEVITAAEAAVLKLGFRIEPIGPGAAAHLLPAYRRALWIVVTLNLGYGVIEAIGGFLAGSQSLKADALDFVGDGLITLLGLLSVRRSSAGRARTALAQGVFLGVLGFGVLGNTAYRVFVQQMPGFETMGVLAAVALVVNVTAAAVLLPHRSGDANVRAVWLFSRNDAIGNVLVLVAAGLVALTRTPWPDLAVGAFVSALFLQSAWAIIRAARRDLNEAAT